MAGKKSNIQSGSLRRSLAVSLAGIRAGGAFAIDGAWHKLHPGGDGEKALDSPFIRREAQRFVADLGRLKGTYVKIGQMLALLGEHFLPPVLTEVALTVVVAPAPVPVVNSIGLFVLTAVLLASGAILIRRKTA